MKKRFILTIEIDTDVSEAKKWAKISDYVDDEIDNALDDFRKQNEKNYTRIRQGLSYKVSLRTIKNFKIKSKTI